MISRVPFFFTRVRARRIPWLTLLSLLALLAAFPATACAAPDDALIRTSGTLPRHGRVVIRSGLAWMDENAALFHSLSLTLRRELSARGMTVIDRPASALEPMPQTPFPDKGDAASADPLLSVKNKDVTGDQGANKAAELGKDGKLPQLKLRGYGTPDKDKDLPASVRAVTSPDVTRALFARSQRQGLPVTRSFTIPGRLPKELTQDAAVADFAVIARFASVRAWAAAPGGGTPFGSMLPGVLVAAAVKGVGALGYGTPAEPAPPGNSYGTPGGYVRGYEGSSPNDFWNRDSDFFQRDYQFKHGPQPRYATPPSDFRQTPGLPPVGTGGAAPASVASGLNEWHFLILDCFDLAPIRSGKEPKPVWRGTARKPGDVESLAKTLPELAQRLTADKAANAAGSGAAAGNGE